MDARIEERIPASRPPKASRSHPRSYTLGQEYVVRFASLEEVDVLVTDSGLDDGRAREIESTGVEVLRV